MLNSDKSMVKIGSFVLLGIFIIVLFFSSFTTVKSGEVGLKVRFGKIVDTQINEGINSLRTVYFDENNLSLMIRNETKPVSIFEKMGQRQTVIKDNYEGLFGYWIEIGRVPVLWDNGNGNFVDANPYFELNYIDSNGVEHTRIIEKAFKPRPFMKETKKSLKSSNKIKEALKKVLKRHGLSIK